MNPIAQVLKSYDKDGSVLVKIYNGFTSKDFKKNVPVMIYFESLPVPFFVESILPKGKNFAIIKFENIDSLEQANDLVKIEFFLEKVSKKKLKPKINCTINQIYKNSNFNDVIELLIGFQVYSEIKTEDFTQAYLKLIGCIVNFHDFSGNHCLEVDISTNINLTNYENKLQSLPLAKSKQRNFPKVNKNKVVLIPFHQDLIISINIEKKIIILEVPFGLL